MVPWLLITSLVFHCENSFLPHWMHTDGHSDNLGIAKTQSIFWKIYKLNLQLPFVDFEVESSCKKRQYARVIQRVRQHICWTWIGEVSDWIRQFNTLLIIRSAIKPTGIISKVVQGIINSIIKNNGVASLTTLAAQVQSSPIILVYILQNRVSDV